MLQTAENVAVEAKISRQEQDAVALLRFRQYQDALADDRAFQKRYMVLPLPVPDASGRKVVATLETDEGVFPTSEDGLAKLKPVLPDGSVTFGSQTHPADGNCGMLVASRDRAAALSRDPRVTVRVLAYGEARVKKGYMAMATVPAARAALQSAGDHDRPGGGDQDAQPVRGERRVLRARDGGEGGGVQSLRLLAGLRPSPGPHGNAPGDGADRGAGAAGWRARPLRGLRCRGTRRQPSCCRWGEQ
jgi:hypothetical protein